MENNGSGQPQPTNDIKASATPSRQFSSIFVILILLIVAVMSGLGGYLLGSKSNNNNNQNFIPSPIVTQALVSSIPTQTVVGPTTPASNCTIDSQCPSGYGCQAMQGQATACPVSNQTVGPNGTVVQNAVISCTPTYSITRGVCKLKKDGTCSTDSDCLSGLLCHYISPNTNGGQIKKCEEPTLGNCTGASDTSCQTGYTCTQGCGPPIGRLGDNTPPPWYCTANEIAGRPHACPICLASNTMITTPQGDMHVTAITVGMQVYSVNKEGKKIVSKVIKTGSTPVPDNHKVVHLVLSDGRSLYVSPNHPTATGTVVGTLKIGDEYDSARVIQTQLVTYWDSKTYDILPDSDTGFYFANNILMGSTLKLQK